MSTGDDSSDPANPPGPMPSSSVLDFLQDIPNSKASPTLFVTVSLFAVAAAFVFFTFLAIRRFCIILYNRRRRRWPRRPESRNDRLDPDRYQDLGPIVDHPIWHIRTVGLNPSIINKIPVVRYKKGDSRIEGTDCAVCLSEFQEDESLRILPKCNHPFHLPCIDTWLRSHKNCPICRSGIVENPMIFPSSDRSAQISDEDQINRESERGEMRLTENNENDSEIRIQIHDPNGSVTGQKIDDTCNEGRTASMGDSDQRPVAERGEMSERRLMETGASSSSSSSPAASVQRSASCNAEVFNPM